MQLALFQGGEAAWAPMVTKCDVYPHECVSGTIVMVHVTDLGRRLKGGVIS